MIKRRDLARALERKRVADWVIFEREQDIAIADGMRREKRTRRRESRALTTFVVHVDDTRGRGSARVEIASQDQGANEMVDRAIGLALASIGTAWKNVPASAPAKVTLLDPAIGKRELPDIASKILDAAKIPASARITREQIVVQTRAGLEAKWEASTFEVDALVGNDKHLLLGRRAARREADLDLDVTIASTASDLGLLAGAAPVKAGPCALVLDANAFLHDDALGVWSVFAAQADAVFERQGLTRYRVGVPVAPGAESIEEPLTIKSNGTLDFLMRSAPISEDGDAVRRFMIVERGIAKDFGMSPREAALRGRDPNGGVRNLEVAKGTWDGAIAPGPLRTVEVRRLQGLSVDRYTGEASLELAIAIEHGATKQPFTGGTIRLDLVAALSHARRSSNTIKRGAYFGPASIFIANANLVI